jgi:hypothetical protein
VTVAMSTQRYLDYKGSRSRGGKGPFLGCGD